MSANMGAKTSAKSGEQADTVDSQGMHYLVSLPRRVVTI